MDLINLFSSCYHRLYLNSCTMHHRIATWVSQRPWRKYTAASTGQGNNGTQRSGMLHVKAVQHASSTYKSRSSNASRSISSLRMCSKEYVGPSVSIRGRLGTWDYGWSRFLWLVLKLKKQQKCLCICRFDISDILHTD